MARISGFQCDVCKTVSTGDETAVMSWLRLRSRADKDDTAFDICSNRCLLKLARERAEATGEVGRRNGSRHRTEDEILEIIAYAHETNNVIAAEKYGVAPTSISRWKKDLSL